jgi:hypothetical protein
MLHAKAFETLTKGLERRNRGRQSSLTRLLAQTTTVCQARLREHCNQCGIIEVTRYEVSRFDPSGHLVRPRDPTTRKKIKLSPEHGGILRAVPIQINPLQRFVISEPDRQFAIVSYHEM